MGEQSTDLGKARRSASSERSHPSSRLEAFSDGVFAFSATLLVVSLEVPGTFADLVANLWSFVGFGASFALLMLMWASHNDFFRRYGLQDSRTVMLNSLFLFLVLFYVYPLKFLSNALMSFYLGIGNTPVFQSADDIRHLMIIYSGGFVAVFGSLILLFLHAHRRRDELGLTEGEIYDNRTMVRHYSIYVAVGMVSIILSLSPLGLRFGGIAGWIYAMLGPLCTWHSLARQRGRRAAE